MQFCQHRRFKCSVLFSSLFHLIDFYTNDIVWQILVDFASFSDIHCEPVN